MAKTNCWEAKGCGRQPGGHHAATLGVCPAATATHFDGVHDGKNAGRACWVIRGTDCEDSPEGSFLAKLIACQFCEFYELVQSEEGPGMIPTPELVSLPT